MDNVSYADLMRHSRYASDPRTLAFAGVITVGLADGRAQLIRGMSESCFQKLMRSCFPGAHLTNARSPVSTVQFDEFDDLLELLLDHRAETSVSMDWLARCIATAAMDDNHLWQDMGLPDRRVLSALLYEFFPTLAELNIKDMKWKKFFYRQLCERTGILICKAPNCGVCTDQAVCFGPEEGTRMISAPMLVAR